MVSWGRKLAKRSANTDSAIVNAMCEILLLCCYHTTLLCGNRAHLSRDSVQGIPDSADCTAHLDMQCETKRRVQALSRHLLPTASQELQNDNASSSSSQQQLTTQNASASSVSGRTESSYARVHGAVSREPAAWTNIESVQHQQLQEVLYHKALDDGIAKV